MKNRSSIVFLVVSCFLLSFTSCRQGGEYYAFQQIKSGSWDKKNTLSIPLDSLRINPLKKYTASIELTHNNQYPYQNLWLIVSTNFRDTLMVCDTMDIRLTDKNGRWIGNGTGGLHQLSVPYKASLTLDSTRNYTVCIRHFMSDEILMGVEKIGLKIAEE